MGASLPAWKVWPRPPATPEEIRRSLYAPHWDGLAAAFGNMNPAVPADPRPVIVHAWFDDTGSHERHGLFRWIGLVATVDVWTVFSAEWFRILNASPPIYYWHTTSAHNGKLFRSDNGERIDRADREAKESALCELLGRYHQAMIAIDISVSVDEHAEHFIGNLNINKDHPYAEVYLEVGLQRPEYAALIHAISAGLNFARSWSQAQGQGGRKMVFIFFEDREDSWQDDVCFSMKALRRMLTPDDRKSLGQVLFLPGKGAGGGAPLEAADLYAWHVQRNASGKAASALESLQSEQLSKIHCHPLPVTPEWLRQVARDIGDASHLSLGERWEPRDEP